MSAGTARPRAVTVRAPGKINVSLAVGAPRGDGYHEIATTFQAISLYEDVRASHAETITVEFAGPVDAAPIAADPSNFVLRAARLLAEHAGHRGGVRLQVTKRVPISAGLGGGSADAAATLVACDALWQTGLSRERLAQLAARLGADVPFALTGGTAIGTGRGSELSPALATGTIHWVLVVWERGTPAVDTYRALDEHRARYRADITPPRGVPRVPGGVLHALRSGDPHALAEAVSNDLQAPAVRARPELFDAIEVGERAGALLGFVVATGPTVAFLAESTEHAIDLQVALAASGYRALRVHGPVAGARILEGAR